MRAVLSCKSQKSPTITQTSQTEAYDTDVLIIGAGPAGLMTACELAHCGVSCRIIEKAQQRSLLSRALIVQPRTLEILTLLGLERAFIQKGFISQGINIGFNTARDISVDMYHIDARFPYLLYISQSETEKLLETYVNAQGVTVERGVTWQSCITGDSCVTSQVFLAGDAAHVHSQAGGQGMNVGLQDAYNLAWKLGLVIKSQAPDALLDTYQEERHRIGAQVERFTGILLNSFLLKNSLLKMMRNVAAQSLVPRPGIQRLLGEMISGIGATYRFSQLSRQQRNPLLSTKAIQAGDRVPDVELSSTEEPELWLYSHLRTAPTFSLLI